uniref:Endonuclease n=1 Tax=Strigamia maritima TaxID=126957 RepID=T1IK68_STRMM
MKTYLLIARCGKQYDQLRLIIDQWSDDEFKWEKVSNALLAEENHHRYAAKAQEQSSANNEKVLATTSIGRGKNNKFQRGRGARTGQRAQQGVQSAQQPSQLPRSQQSSERKPSYVVTCYNCQGQGHIARDCPSPRKPKPARTESGSVSTSVGVCLQFKIWCWPQLIPMMGAELGEGFSSIQGIGDIRLNVQAADGRECTVTLKSACYAPNFRRNLISIAKLDKGNVRFTEEKGVLKFFDDKPEDCFMYGKLADSHSLYKLVGQTLFAAPDKQTIGKNFHKRVECQTGKRVKAIRTDKVGEFVSREFEDYLNSQGIEIQRTNPGSPEMNSMAQRINRTIHDGVRTVLDDTQLSEDLWAKLALTVVHLKNRFPHSSIGNQIPYVLFRGRKLVVTYLKVPGSIAYVHIPAHKRPTKHSPRAWKGVMLGYAMSTRGYRIWDLDTNVVIETKHVKIIEKLNWQDFENINDDGTLMTSDKNVKIDDDENDEPDDILYDILSTTDDGSSDSDGDGDEEVAQQHQMLPTPVKPTKFQASGSGAQSVSQAPLKPLSIVDSPLAPHISTRRRATVKTKIKSPKPLRERVVTTYSVPNMIGWTKEVITRQKGVTKGDVDTYFYDASGKGPMRSYADIEKSCKKLNVPFSKENFQFEPRKRNEPNVSTARTQIFLVLSPNHGGELLISILSRI